MHAGRKQFGSEQPAGCTPLPPFVDGLNSDCSKCGGFIGLRHGGIYAIKKLTFRMSFKANSQQFPGGRGETGSRASSNRVINR